MKTETSTPNFACPTCGTKMEMTMKRLLEEGITCPACSQQIALREDISPRILERLRAHVARMAARQAG